MTSQEFCYWLQGLFELGNPQTLDARQVEMVKQHLALTFVKVTPAPGSSEKLLREALERASTRGGACGGISYC